MGTFRITDEKWNSMSKWHRMMIKTHKGTYVLLKTPNSKHLFYKKGTHKGTYVLLKTPKKRTDVLLKTPKNEQMFS